ncbi:DUF5709 domain-containing protein [Streptomyces graminofaciens]|uniref:DUF5709 domain-containing protein n=1 Tax=Streptomyces graminofaciens TaxID=68212 RepID=UPI0025731B8C|nr:DUF5709 domain-containing protein [Streptomyces graminofaciens]
MWSPAVSPVAPRARSRREDEGIDGGAAGAEEAVMHVVPEERLSSSDGREDWQRRRAGRRSIVRYMRVYGALVGTRGPFTGGRAGRGPLT